jgi:hypothetical protein
VKEQRVNGALAWKSLALKCGQSTFTTPSCPFPALLPVLPAPFDSAGAGAVVHRPCRTRDKQSVVVKIRISPFFFPPSPSSRRRYNPLPTPQRLAASRQTSYEVGRGDGECPEAVLAVLRPANGGRKTSMKVDGGRHGGEHRKPRRLFQHSRRRRKIPPADAAIQCCGCISPSSRHPFSLSLLVQLGPFRSCLASR